MTRNSFSRMILALAWVALPALSQAQDWASIQVQTVPVAPGIVMLAGAGGNIGVLVGKSGTLIVDSQFPQLHDKIVAAITAAAGGPVRYLLNTNWHFDHVSGNERFRQAGAVKLWFERLGLVCLPEPPRHRAGITIGTPMQASRYWIPCEISPAD